MKKILKKYKIIFIILIDIFGINLIISLLNLINLLNNSVSSILIMLNTIFLYLYLGIYFGKKTIKKGFLTGIKVGLIGIGLMFIISILFFQIKINISMILYYLILLTSSIIGAMIGINKKENT